MSTLNFVAISGIVFIFILLGLLFLLPTDQKKKKKRKRKVTLSSEQKDWQQTALKLERYIQSLRGAIAAFEKKEQHMEKQLLIEKAKTKKFQEKLSQEKQWHQKEQNTLEKKMKEADHLKTDLQKAQNSFAKAHAQNLRMQRDIEQLKKEKEAVNEKRRTLEGQSHQLKSKLEQNRKDIAQLRKENAELKKKQDDVSWIAKSEYTSLEKRLKEKEKEIERIKREII